MKALDKLDPLIKYQTITGDGICHGCGGDWYLGDLTVKFDDNHVLSFCEKCEKILRQHFE